jgi:hypothetical protein
VAGRHPIEAPAGALVSPAFFESLDPDVYPSSRRVTPVIAAHDEDGQFLTGVELLITGLRSQVASRRRAPAH